MPFTPTHIVAVLPFWPLRRWLPFPALAIGAMVPDIGMFFPIADYAQTHRPLGVFTTCLPLGVAIFAVFEAVMRRPLVALLPAWFQCRLQSSPQLPTTPRLKPQLVFYTGLSIAIVLGAFTHIFWDSFSHQDRWGTELIPRLSSTVSFGGYEVPGYKLIQYGSSFIGLPLLVVLSMISLRRIPPSEVATRGAPTPLKWLALVVVFVVPLLVAAYAVAACSSYYQALGTTIKLSGAILSVLCTIYCAAYQALAIDERGSPNASETSDPGRGR